MKAIYYSWEYMEQSGHEEIAVFTNNNVNRMNRVLAELREKWPAIADRFHADEYAMPKMNPMDVTQLDEQHLKFFDKENKEHEDENIRVVKWDKEQTRHLRERLGVANGEEIF
jgi:hypothetical protein